MPNLSRAKNQFLVNSVAAGTADFEAITTDMYGAGRKVFLGKQDGVVIPGNLAADSPKRMQVNIMPGSAGTKGVQTVHLVGTYNPSITEYEFIISVIRKARFNGSTAELQDIQHDYNYIKRNFSTSAAGAFNATDVADILSNLAANINADDQINDNAILTGAVVDALYVAEGSGVPAYIKLTAKDASLRFEVQVDPQVFDIDGIAGIPVVQVAPKGTKNEVAKLFCVKPEDAGTLPKVPTLDLYAKVVITQITQGDDNVVADGLLNRKQVYEYWVPNDAVQTTAGGGLGKPLILALQTAALAGNVLVNGSAVTFTA